MSRKRKLLGHLLLTLSLVGSSTLSVADALSADEVNQIEGYLEVLKKTGVSPNACHLEGISYQLGEQDQKRYLGGKKCDANDFYKFVCDFKKKEDRKKLSASAYAELASEAKKAGLEPGSNEFKKFFYKSLKEKYGDQVQKTFSAVRTQMIEVLNSQLAEAQKQENEKDSAVIKALFEKMHQAVAQTEIDFTDGASQVCISNQRNAFFVRVSGSANKVIVCPGAILSGDPGELTGSIARALGHSIDSCAIDLMTVGQNPSLPLSGLDDGLRSCLGSKIQKPKEATVLPPLYQPSSPLQDIDAFRKNSSKLAEKFAVYQNAPRCNKPFTNDELQSGNYKQRDQSNDAVAQFYANKTLARVGSIEGAANNYKDKADFIRESLSAYCDAGYTPKGPNPDPRRMINNIVAMDPEIRAVMGCNKVKDKNPCEAHVAIGYKEFVDILKNQDALEKAVRVLAKEEAERKAIAPEASSAQKYPEASGSGEGDSPSGKIKVGAGGASGQNPLVITDYNKATEEQLRHRDQARAFAIANMQEKCMARVDKGLPFSEEAFQNACNGKSRVDVDLFGKDELVDAGGYKFVIGCQARCLCQEKECYYPKAAYRGQAQPKDVKPVLTQALVRNDLEFIFRQDNAQGKTSLASRACFLNPPDENGSQVAEGCKSSQKGWAEIQGSPVKMILDASRAVVDVECKFNCSCGDPRGCRVEPKPKLESIKPASEAELAAAFAGKEPGKDPVFNSIRPKQIQLSVNSGGEGVAPEAPLARPPVNGQLVQSPETGEPVGAPRTKSGEYVFQIANQRYDRLPPKYKQRLSARWDTGNRGTNDCNAEIKACKQFDGKKVTKILEYKNVGFKAENSEIYNFKYECSYTCKEECKDHPEKCLVNFLYLGQEPPLEAVFPVKNVHDREYNRVADWSFFGTLADQDCLRRGAQKDPDSVGSACALQPKGGRVQETQLFLLPFRGEFTKAHLPYTCDYELDCNTQKVVGAVAQPRALKDPNQSYEEVDLSIEGALPAGKNKPARAAMKAQQNGADVTVKIGDAAKSANHDARIDCKDVCWDAYPGIRETNSQMSFASEGDNRCYCAPLDGFKGTNSCIEYALAPCDPNTDRLKCVQSSQSPTTIRYGEVEEKKCLMSANYAPKAKANPAANSNLAQKLKEQAHDQCKAQVKKDTHCREAGGKSECDVVGNDRSILNKKSLAEFTDSCTPGNIEVLPMQKLVTVKHDEDVYQFACGMTCVCPEKGTKQLHCVLNEDLNSDSALIVVGMSGPNAPAPAASNPNQPKMEISKRPSEAAVAVSVSKAEVQDPNQESGASQAGAMALGRLKIVSTGDQKVETFSGKQAGAQAIGRFKPVASEEHKLETFSGKQAGALAIGRYKPSSAPSSAAPDSKQTKMAECQSVCQNSFPHRDAMKDNLLVGYDGENRCYCAPGNGKLGNNECLQMEYVDDCTPVKGSSGCVKSKNGPGFIEYQKLDLNRCDLDKHYPSSANANYRFQVENAKNRLDEQLKRATNTSEFLMAESEKTCLAQKAYQPRRKNFDNNCWIHGKFQSGLEFRSFIDSGFAPISYDGQDHSVGCAAKCSCGSAENGTEFKCEPLDQIYLPKMGSKSVRGIILKSEKHVISPRPQANSQTQAAPATPARQALKDTPPSFVLKPTHRTIPYQYKVYSAEAESIRAKNKDACSSVDDEDLDVDEQFLNSAKQNKLCAGKYSGTARDYEARWETVNLGSATVGKNQYQKHCGRVVTCKSGEVVGISRELFLDGPFTSANNQNRCRLVEFATPENLNDYEKSGKLYYASGINVLIGNFITEACVNGKTKATKVSEDNKGTCSYTCDCKTGVCNYTEFSFGVSGL